MLSNDEFLFFLDEYVFKLMLEKSGFAEVPESGFSDAAI